MFDCAGGIFLCRAKLIYSHGFFFFFFLKGTLFIYLFILAVFVSVGGLSLVAASGGHSSSRCAGISLSQPLLLWSTGSRRAGSVVVAHGPSCSAARGIFPDQGSNLCPLHWQADSQPLRHQGSPLSWFLTYVFKFKKIFYIKIDKIYFLVGSSRHFNIYIFITIVTIRIQTVRSPPKLPVCYHFIVMPSPYP